MCARFPCMQCSTHPACVHLVFPFPYPSLFRHIQTLNTKCLLLVLYLTDADHPIPQSTKACSHFPLDSQQAQELLSVGARVYTQRPDIKSPGAGEMKPCKPSDLGSNSRTHIKKPVIVMYDCNPSTREAEMCISLGLTDQSAQPTWRSPGQ